MVDLTKPVQARDGREVRILCTDAVSVMGSVIGLIRDAHGNDQVAHWYSDGHFMADKSYDDRDLTNVPPPKKKVKVEVHLRYAPGGSQREIFPLAKFPEDRDQWTSKVIASTTIEMEYEEPQS